jgi:L-ascorbate metabolism protein UlaG (beta-lactamase superfamily)
MKKLDVKINYLFHSGFAVETKNHFLIFDYYKDSVDTGEKKLSNGAISVDEINTHKNILVFSSHNHNDHYSPVILKWQGLNKDIKYILSSDIELDSSDADINKISAYEELNIDDVYIKSYGSTDVGVSFLVSLDEVTVFHAGDLNWWSWWYDTPGEIENAEKLFKAEIDRIKGESIDIAFFPVDPRLKHNYSLGAEYFMETINPGYLIPMHFGKNFEAVKKFTDKANSYTTRVVEITHRGQEIVL